MQNTLIFVNVRWNYGIDGNGTYRIINKIIKKIGIEGLFIKSASITKIIVRTIKNYMLG